MNARPDLEHDLIEQLTLNQGATGSTPVRPTNYINDLGRSRQDPLFHKTCFRSVSGNRATAFPGISTAGVEFFDHTGLTMKRSNGYKKVFPGIIPPFFSLFFALIS
jgi:hypothetical protein